jgi:ABC-type nitrate/sulfonate/bicarbonate transport system substrate-binding protein
MPDDVIEIQGYYRSHSHLPIWEVIDRAGFWREVGLELKSFEFCNSSAQAEGALFSGGIDFVSGNHISPYALVARGKPIASLTSPSNSTSDTVVSRQPIGSLADLRGKRIVDTTKEDPIGGFHHPRGNHTLYLLKAGVGADEVEWIELADWNTDEFRELQLQALQEGRADAGFVTGGAERYERAGFHVLPLPELPMINGPTITSSVRTLQGKPGLGERLVRAQILAVHYARTRRPETEEILKGLSARVPEVGPPRYNSVARIAVKPYPEPEAVMNAYELCCLSYPEAKEVSPLALWDLHYLRDLDDSGFIDELYS